MKRLKVILAMGMVITLGAMLAGCGSSKGSDDAENTQQEASADEEITLKVGYAYEAGFSYEGDETVENNSWTELYKEHGINLEMVFNVESSQKNEKLSQLIMSNDYPDFMAVDAEYYKDWVQQNVLCDLTDYFDKYASDETKEFYETDYGKRGIENATIDGKLYSMPGPAGGYDGIKVLWIRKDWLDNLGLDIPETIEEFYEVARAFTEDDPDGDGVDNTYGLALDGKNVFASTGDISGVFQMFGSCPEFSFLESDGHAVYGGALLEESKAALEMLKDMYDNGYVPSDFVTMGEDQINQMLTSGSIGMSVGAMSAMGGNWADLLEIVPEAEFIAVPLPGYTADENGTAYYSPGYTGTYFALSSKHQDNEEYVKAFFEVVNLSVHYMAKQENLTQDEYEKYNGLAGVYTGYRCSLAAYGNPLKNLEALEKHQHALETGDTSVYTPENLRDYNAMLEYTENKDFRDELSESELASFNSGLFFWSVWGAQRCSYAAISEMVDKDNFLYSAYNDIATDNMVNNRTTLETLTKETIVDIIMGNKAISDYDAFVDTWNSMGGDVVTAEADEWYQEHK